MLLNRLSQEIDRKQKEFQEFNDRIARFSDQIPTQAKGALVLELWADYDKLQELKRAQEQVDLSKVYMHFTRGPRG